MAKPTKTPSWATSGTKTEPSSGQKAAGFAVAAKWAAQHANWILGNISDWIDWLNSGYLTRSGLTDRTPVFATTDRDGRARHYLGPEGYIMGPAIQETYVWAPVNSGANASHGAAIGGAQMTAKAISGGLVRVMPPSATAPALGAPRARLKILSGGAQDEANISAAQGANGATIGDLDNQCAVLETELCFESDQQIAAYCGFSEDGYSGGYSAAALNETGKAFVHFRADYNSPATETTWHCVVGDGTNITAVDSGVSSVMTEFSTFRIEYHGANTPLGVDNSDAPVVRFFINGVLEATISDGSVPTMSDLSTSGFSPGVSHGSVAGADAECDLWVGPMKVACTARLAGNVPA